MDDQGCDIPSKIQCIDDWRIREDLAQWKSIAISLYYENQMLHNHLKDTYIDMMQREKLKYAAPQSATSMSVSPKPEAPMSVAPKPEAPMSAAFKSVTPMTVAPKPEAPMPEALNLEAHLPVAPKSVAPQSVAPNLEAPKSVAPQSVAPEPKRIKSIDPQMGDPYKEVKKAARRKGGKQEPLSLVWEGEKPQIDPEERKRFISWYIFHKVRRVREIEAVLTPLENEEEEYIEEPEEEKEKPLNLVSNERPIELKKLYGTHGSQIGGVEVALQLNYERLRSQMNPGYWPELQLNLG